MSATGKVLFLIGFMGSGKSHYALALSDLLNVSYVDLDARIETQEGLTIPEIFKQKGESYFRQIETDVLHQTTKEFAGTKEVNQGNLSIFGIVACGGGVPCFNGNMDWMNANGLTLWLAPPVEVLVQRLGRENEHRPLVAGLEGAELEKQVRERLASREAFYGRSKIKVVEPNPSPIELMKIIEHAQENV